MYERNSDFNITPPTPRQYFSMPEKEIYFFYSEREKAWVYEIINNCDFSLKHINQGVGRLVRINNSTDLGSAHIQDYLEKHHPGAAIEMYFTEDDWVSDFLEGRVH
jgi:hypothetical protein